MLEVSFYTGLIIGSLMCSYVIQQNYAFGFFIAAIFSGTALLYVVFFLEESLAPYEVSWQKILLKKLTPKIPNFSVGIFDCSVLYYRRKMCCLNYRMSKKL